MTNLTNSTASTGLQPSGLFVTTVGVLYVCSVCVCVLAAAEGYGSVEPTSCETNIPPPVSGEVSPQSWLQAQRLPN